MAREIRALVSSYSTFKNNGHWVTNWHKNKIKKYCYQKCSYEVIIQASCSSLKALKNKSKYVIVKLPKTSLEVVLVRLLESN